MLHAEPGDERAQLLGPLVGDEVRAVEDHVALIAGEVAIGRGVHPRVQRDAGQRLVDVACATLELRVSASSRVARSSSREAK